MVDIKKIVEIINGLGIRTFTFDYGVYNNYIVNCYNWYKGRVPTFHIQKGINNGFKSCSYEKAKLFMGKRVCEDLAGLICSENINIVIDDKNVNELLLGHDEMSGILGNNDFWIQLNKCYELTCGLGTGAMEVILENLLSMDGNLLSDKNTKIKIARYDALNIVPLTWDNCGNIEEVAFIDEYQIKNDYFLELRLHVIGEDGNYVIYNKKYKVNYMEAQGTQDINNKFMLINDSSILEKFETKSDIPWFICFKTAQVNSYDIKSPMGASVYGDSIDVLESVDDAFNALRGDLRFGAKKVNMHKSLLSKDKDGNVILPDDGDFTNQVYFFGNAKDDPADVKNMIVYNDAPIRSKELSEAINLSLDILSFKVGLGHGYYKFTSDGVQKTAKEVISQNSDLYRNVCKQQLAIEKPILSLMRTIIYANNFVFKTNYNVNCPIAINFDASIIEDITQDRERALKEVELGILSIKEYRAKYYSELENIEDANKNKE